MTPSHQVVTPAEARALHASLQERLSVWTVTERPRDHPGSYVARLHLALPAPQATLAALVAPTLDDLRELLPPGLTRLDRNPADDPVIVETWL